MNKTAFATALSMINQFEAASHLMGQEAERLVISILDCCGYVVTERGFAENQDGGVDCYFFAPIDGKPQRIGVDIRSWTRKIDAGTVQKALDIAAGAQFDRSWIIARSGFTVQAQQLADSYGPGKLDLLTGSDLRNWVAKQSEVTSEELQDVAIIRRAMQELACEIARDPESLYRREWRDLERILREFLNTWGFAHI